MSTFTTKAIRAEYNDALWDWRLAKKEPQDAHMVGLYHIRVTALKRWLDARAADRGKRGVVLAGLRILKERARDLGDADKLQHAIDLIMSQAVTIKKLKARAS